MTAQPKKIEAKFDAATARADFEIFAKPVYGKPLVYLDSAASAQKPRQVLDAMRDFASTDYANVHRGVHYLSGKATDAYEAARRTVQTFLHAAHEDEIVFTKGGTEAINLVSYSWLAPRIQPGDEIVLSVMEHHSNIVPWHFLRERQGAVLRWVDVRDDGALDIEALDAAIGPKTKLVAITHMSNVLGTVTPLKEIVTRAHAKGVPVLADGCQGAVHEIIDVQALDIDFYAITGHKLYGPTGIGALYGKRAHLKAMRPFNGGGEMIREVTRDVVTYADPPARFEAGTPPIIESVGLAAAIDYMDSFDREAVRAHEHDLLAYAREQVRQFNWLRVIGDAPGKGAILSFETDGMHAHDVATILDREGVAVRAGHHCAQPLMERFGVASTSRASFAMYNTRADVDALIAALAKARKILGTEAMDDSLRELYQDVILDHSRHPRHFGALEGATNTAEGHNPLCGDRVKINLIVDKNDRIADIMFEGKGCAISQASASMMTDMIVGRTIAEAEKLMNGFLHLVKGEDATELKGDDREMLDVMAGVSAFPMRVKCATLAWHTMKSALEGGDSAATE